MATTSRELVVYEQWRESQQWPNQNTNPPQLPPPVQQISLMSPPTNPQKQTQLPAQPQPNPNSQQPQQPMYSVDAQQYPAYTLGVVHIHLRSSTSLPMPKPPLIIEIPDTPTTS